MSADRGDLPGIAVTRPMLATVLNLLLVVAGLAALLGIEVRELPDVDRPIVGVRAVYPGAAPETVDAEVTSVIESAVARVSGIREIRSSSEENSARVRLEFNPDVDLNAAASDVREALARVTRQLPDEVEQVQATKADEDANPILQIAVLSDVHDTMSLTRIVENDIVPELLAVDGVAAVTPFGTRERQLRVLIDPPRLSRFGLTVSDVAAALRQAPFDVPVGSFRSDDQTLLVRAEATAATPERIGEVVIRDRTRVNDVAEVLFAPADANSFTRLDGRPMVGLGVVRQARSNTISISRAIHERVKRLNTRFGDLELRVIDDDAQFIESSVGEVLTSLTFTSLIVIGTIWLFFGAIRATLAPSTTIPVALIGTLAGIWLCGFSINLLTLLALVLATGLIVDDSIVVLENIQRLQKAGHGRRAAALIGTRQVFFAVVSTTAVLIAVFVPIAFLPSTTGRLFREFAFVLAVAVVISSFVALTLVPAIAARLDLRGGSTPGPLAWLGNRITAFYGVTLRLALRLPLITLLLSLAAIVLAAGAFMSLKQELLPSEDRARIFVFARGPDGVGLDYMARQAQQIEAVLDPWVRSGVIRSQFTVIGRYDPNVVYITAPLAPWDERAISQDELIAQLRPLLGRIPGSRVSVFGRGSLQLGWGNRSGIEVALTGGDYDGIFTTARRFADALENSSPLLENVEISYQPTQPQLSIRIDRRRVADLDVPLDELAVTLRAMVGGSEIIDLNVNDQAIPVFLRSERGRIRSPEDLRNLFVRSRSGELVPLSTVTRLVEEGVAAELDRTEQRRAIEVEADIVGDATLAEAVAEIRRFAASELPDDIEMVLKGEAQTLGESNNELLLTVGFALLIVMLVLVAQFESVTSPLIVMLTVPFGMAAALIALWLTGSTLNLFSQIGLIMLIGLMAKNGILIVEFADQRRAEGANVHDAVLDASLIRLRPIAMTLISTVLGALPLIVASGAGAEARSAIGWVVFGGLALAAQFTLYLSPVLYLLLARFSVPRSHGAEQLAAELAALDQAELGDEAPR